MRRYFIDMDGVTAKWQSAPLEELFKEGFFLSRQPDATIIKAVQKLHNKGEDVNILTSAFMEGTARQEKRRWLKENGLGDINVIMVPYGEKKADYIYQSDNVTNILLDDFSKNLHEWEATLKNGIGIKYFNGVNGTKGTWKKRSVSHTDSVEDIVAYLLSI